MKTADVAMCFIFGLIFTLFFGIIPTSSASFGYMTMTVGVLSVTETQRGIPFAYIREWFYEDYGIITQNINPWALLTDWLIFSIILCAIIWIMEKRQEREEATK